MKIDKDIPFHLSRGMHDTIAGKERLGRFRKAPGRVEGEYQCPSQKKPFSKFAEIYPSDDETEYYCPVCDALVMRRSGGVEEVIDRDHLP